MCIRTVGDLRAFLEERKVSPETLSKQVKISPMTLRRLVRKSPSTLIPEKYLPALDLATASPLTRPPVLGSLHTILGVRPGASFDAVIEELEESGRQCGDYGKLEEQTHAKCQDPNVGRELLDLVGGALKSLVSKEVPIKYKAVVAGALLYFINPVDLIPDTIPVIGYLDDFAVLTLAMGLLIQFQKSKAGHPPELTPR
jgi:hypothetical protein